MLMKSKIKSVCAASVLALALGACTPSQVSIADIVTQVQTQCSYKTDVQSITAVIATVLAGFSPAAGATAQVASAIATQVEDMVCNAVKAQVAQEKISGKLKAGEGPHEVDTKVNGVVVKGTYTGS